MRGVGDDDEVQKRGVLACVYYVGGGLDIDLELVRKATKLRDALSARFDCVHVCSNELRLTSVFSRSRMRFRARYGSDEECRFQPDLNEPTGYGRFMSFSNLGFLLPTPNFASPGGVSLEHLLCPSQWCPPETASIGPPFAYNRTDDCQSTPARFCESPAKSYMIYDPSPNDILLGRGIPIQQRPGNVRFRDIIYTHKDKYEQGGKGAKVAAMAYIVDLVKEEGGRLLKELEYGRSWVEVDEATARVKVNNAFRTQRQVRQATLKKDKSTA
jgi:hypothetical protein